MSGRDEFQIRFVKPSDSADEEDNDSSSNLMLLGSPKSKEFPAIQETTNTPESAKNPGKLRLAVSELSMKLAQRLEDKVNASNSEEKTNSTTGSPADRKVDRFKKIALDVSKNVKTWSMEQQKLVGSTPKEDSRGRSSSLSSTKSSTVSEKLSVDGESMTSCESLKSKPTIAEEVEDPETPTKFGMKKPKSFSFNENLSSYCTANKQTSSSGDIQKQAKVLSSVEENQQELSFEEAQEAVSLNDVSQHDEIMSKQRVSPIQFFKDYVNDFISSRYFPIVLLAVLVVVLRFIGVADMIVGCLIGTYVTWYIYVYQPRSPITHHDDDEFSKHERMSKTVKKSISNCSLLSGDKGNENMALMHLSHTYNPCSFRLRYSYYCVVSLQGSLLKISVLDKKSSKDAKNKFSNLQSPPINQLRNFTFADSHNLDLLQYSVALTPKKLAKKRYFNKKYPIMIVRKGNDSDSTAEASLEVINAEFYLFTLSQREKETWYNLLCCASQNISLKPFDLLPVKRVKTTNSMAEISSPQKKDSSVRMSKLRSTVSMNDIGEDIDSFEPTAVEIEDTVESEKKNDDPYQLHYLTRREQWRWFISQAIGLAPTNSLSWFNAFAWRVFFELWTVDSLKQQLEKKLQGKLNKIMLPRIIEPLRLSELAFGNRMPQFKNQEAPFCDSRGLWLTFEVDYDGGLQGTILTRVNLLKAKSSNGCDSKATTPSPGADRSDADRYLDILYDESAESCSESSESEDDTPPDPSLMGAQSPNAHKADLIERLTSSKYFAKIIAINSVEKAAERMSLIPLTLSIQVNRIQGKMKINFPPPPSGTFNYLTFDHLECLINFKFFIFIDRIWIGFEEGIDIDLSLKPKVGSVELTGRTLQPIVSYLEKKILSEFRKKLVLPSLDDLYLGFFRSSLFSSLDPDPNIEKSSSPSSPTNNNNPSPTSSQTETGVNSD